MTSRTVYPITTIGAPLVERLPQTGRWGTVFALFRRSCYLESVDGQVFCLADYRLGEGPLTMGVGFPENIALCSLGVSDGCHLEMDGVDLRLGRSAVLTIAGASIWSPEPSGANASPEEILRRLDALTSLVRPLIPSEGLAGIVAHAGVLAKGKLPSIDSANPVACVAIPYLSRLSDGLGCSGLKTIDESVTRLLGLGPGLTPSGDDLLGGMLIALRAMPDTSSQPSMDLFAECVTRHAAVKTTRISSAMLEQSAKGNGSAAQHLLLNCLLGVDTDSKITSADLNLIRIGHTSGWDTLAGILLGIYLGLRINQALEATSAAIQETIGVPA